jgi:hypothetical protein
MFQQQLLHQLQLHARQVEERSQLSFFPSVWTKLKNPVQETSRKIYDPACRVYIGLAPAIAIAGYVYIRFTGKVCA